MSFSSQRHAGNRAAAESQPQRERTKLAPGAKAAAVDSAPPFNVSSGGKPLDPRVRSEMEARFGTSFDDVRVHDNDQAHRNAAQLESKAFTVGSDIVSLDGELVLDNGRQRHRVQCTEICAALERRQAIARA